MLLKVHLQPLHIRIFRRMDNALQLDIQRQRLQQLGISLNFFPGVLDY